MPWCGTKFKRNSFKLLPNSDRQDGPSRHVRQPRLRDSAAKTPLPILAIDEPIYRRLPCFIIATVDKFAAMPWTGPVGAFFAESSATTVMSSLWSLRFSGHPLPGDGLLPPDLVIQDELHLHLRAAGNNGRALQRH